MDHSTVITWVAGLLQLSVAAYALRLNRLFGARRVGWSLFAAFLLLAIFHAIHSAGPLRVTPEIGIRMDVVYGLISLLLLTGMVHMESVLKMRVRLEGEEQKARFELESRIKEKTTALTTANEALQKEMAERERATAQMENTYKELLTASHKAGMSEVATSVLHNVGNVLNSVNISASVVADHLEHFKASSVTRIAMMLKEHSADLGNFLTNDPKGRQIPAYLTELGEHLVEEQDLILKEVAFVKKKIEHIKEIIAMQQNYAQFSGVKETVKVCDLVEDALQMNTDALARHDVDIIRDFDHSIPEINVEKHKVLQVLVNLIRNAKYACDESGRKDKQLTIRVHNGEDRVRIAVTDNGIGIPAENLQKIFNHGFTTRKGGHGFGLHGGALAAKEMGGALKVISAGPGKGSTFTLELPVQSSKTAFLAKS